MTKTITRLALVGALFVSMTQVASADATYKEGSFAVSARAGIAPASFNRNVSLKTKATNSNATGSSTLTTTQTKTFGKVYAMPFTAGADLGYFLKDDLELFLNFDYAHAAGKKIVTTSGKASRAVGTTWKFRPYTTFGGYVGARSYFCGSDNLLPFVGAKLGLQRAASCSKAETITGNFQPDATFKRATHKACTAFSGGVQFGVDYLLADNYSLTLMSEIIGTSGKRYNEKNQVHKSVTATSGTALESQVTRSPTGVFSFPLTLGVRIRM